VQTTQSQRSTARFFMPLFGFLCQGSFALLLISSARAIELISSHDVHQYALDIRAEIAAITSDLPIKKDGELMHKIEILHDELAEYFKNKWANRKAKERKGTGDDWNADKYKRDGGGGGGESGSSSGAHTPIRGIDYQHMDNHPWEAAPTVPGEKGGHAAAADAAVEIPGEEDDNDVRITHSRGVRGADADPGKTDVHRWEWAWKPFYDWGTEVSGSSGGSSHGHGDSLRDGNSRGGSQGSGSRSGSQEGRDGSRSRSRGGSGSQVDAHGSGDGSGAGTDGESSQGIGVGGRSGQGGGAGGEEGSEGWGWAWKPAWNPFDDSKGSQGANDWQWPWKSGSDSQGSGGHGSASGSQGSGNASGGEGDGSESRSHGDGSASTSQGDGSGSQGWGLTWDRWLWQSQTGKGDGSGSGAQGDGSGSGNSGSGGQGGENGSGNKGGGSGSGQGADGSKRHGRYGAGGGTEGEEDESGSAGLYICLVLPIIAFRHLL